MVLSTTLPEEAFCLTRRFGDRLMCNSEFYACKKTGTKKPPVGGFTTLLIALIILFFPMVPGVGLEPTQRERRGILNSKQDQ